MLFNKQRAKQLENRILKLSVNHDKLHTLAFPKDGSDGDYQKHQKLRTKWYDDHKHLMKKGEYFDSFELDGAPGIWDDSELSQTLSTSNRIIDMIRNELLAINYYNAVRNSLYTNKMIRDAKDCINKYDYAGFGRRGIETANLFPKSKEEIAEKEKWDNATFVEKLQMKHRSYSVSSKKANDKCHSLVVKVCKVILSDKKINREKIEVMTEKGIQKISKICTIVEDKESVRAIEHPINLALKCEGYGFEINVYDR